MKKNKTFKLILILIASLFITNNVVIAQDIKPILFGEKVETSIDEEKLYSEFDKLFDEFNNGCYSKKIGSRSPFINLVERALNKSGSTYSSKSKKIKGSDKKCVGYILDDLDFTFEHYYKHFCKISFIENSEESSQVAEKGESIAEEYFDEFEYECNNKPGKKSKIWFNEWSTGLNVWGKLLADKANINRELIATEKTRIAEESRLKKLAAEVQVKEDARIAKIAKIERKRKQEAQKLKAIAESKKPETNSSNQELAESKPQEQLKEKIIEPTSKPKINYKGIKLDLNKSRIFNKVVDVSYDNTGKFGLTYGEDESHPLCQVSPSRSYGKQILCAVIINKVGRTATLDGNSIVFQYGNFSDFVNKLNKNHNINYIIKDLTENSVCFDNCIIRVAKYAHNGQVYLSFNNDKEAMKIFKRNFYPLKERLDFLNALKNSKDNVL